MGTSSSSRSAAATSFTAGLGTGIVSSSFRGFKTARRGAVDAKVAGPFSSTSVSLAGRKAGDVGEGLSVGTCISVGDGGAGLADSCNWADCSASNCGASGSSSGLGCAVGTGISVGDAGGADPEKPAETKSAEAGIGGGKSGSGNLCSAGALGTAEGGGAPTVAVASSSLLTAGDVGEGTSVGTGMSVGDGGAGPSISRAVLATGASEAETAVGTGTSTVSSSSS
mmetsp:Transcript_44194/g.79519  ORF Transcript_44194/g.79519 Transcript_44194/m.79519 type:complete len:225 (-) Transcript_44194:274-948(-)